MVNRIRKSTGSWLVAEELLENGDPKFVDELCNIADADRLGTFAKTWYQDKRPASRRLMFLYLDRPLKHYRHEALIKRLMKLAEAASDDELMAKFLVMFDRSIRREKQVRHRYDWSSRESWVEETIRTPTQTPMPRTDQSMQYITMYGSDSQREQLQLFKVATRKYLRRRLWRYFRTIGKSDPKRYVKSVSLALVSYTDADCVDGLALLDNWSLMHALFHHCDILHYTASGWSPAPGKSLSGLKPAPMYLDAWKENAEPLLEILTHANCRPIRQWSIGMLKEHHPSALKTLPMRLLLTWLNNDDSDLAQLAADGLKASAEANTISVQQWLQILETANPKVLDLICEIMVEKTSPDSLSLDDLVELACSRPIPVSRLGAKWLGNRTVSSREDCLALLNLCSAEAEPVRAELVQLAMDKIIPSNHYHPTDVLEALDSRFIDVRTVGWDWLIGDEKASSETTNWQRLLETPYDDIQLRIADFLQDQIGSKHNRGEVERQVQTPQHLDVKLLRLLWATVLLNIHRGGKQKPAIVGAIVKRMEEHPDEVTELLPILSVALRSVRSVEFRSGLTGVVQLVQRQPELQKTIEAAFPELIF